MKKLIPLSTYFLLSTFYFVGCASSPKTTTVYIATDRRIETVTNSVGIVCKAVPNAVMDEMLVKLQELKDLKTEQKVDKRVSK